MKSLFATVMLLFAATSVWAQGQIVAGVCAEEQVVTASNVIFLRTVLPSSSSWQSPRTLSTAGDVSLIEASRQRTLTDAPLLPLLPPTPTEGASFTTTPNFQSSALTIQAVPEPSSFTLFVVGLLSGASIFRRKFAGPLPPTDSNLPV